MKRSLFISVIILIFIGGLVGFTTISSNEINEQSVLAYYTAYELQELCFQGHSGDTTEGQMEYAQCESYIKGALDAVYFATRCQEAAKAQEILELLSRMDRYANNEELQKTPAVLQIFNAWSVTQAGRNCSKQENAS